MAIPQYEIEFTKDGLVFDDAQVTKLLEDLPRFSDLLVMSHGWNNDLADARQLYDAFFDSVERVLATGVVTGLDRREFAQVRLFWPSKKFTDEELIPGGGAASATRENDDALLQLLEELKAEPIRLGGHETNSAREAALTRAQQLVDKLPTQAEARREFVLLLRSIVDPSDAHVDDGSEEFFTREPEELFDNLEEPIIAPAASGTGGATGLRPGGAAGLIDGLKGILAAARRVANFVTYYEMKTRSGTVGRTGLAPVLLRARDRSNEIKLHLIGHSFGGRLVTAAGHALPPQTPTTSLTLLQAAYSHNGLGNKFDGRNDGAFRRLLSEHRVSGPVLITHTKNDRAVGIAYPLASRLSRDQASALGDENDPYGGMGRNGARFTPEAEGVAGNLLDVGGAYEFGTGKVYNLKADEFIGHHSDIAGFQVAYALLNSVRSI